MEAMNAKIKTLLPDADRAQEALGLMMIAFGACLGLAIFSYQPADLRALLNGGTVHNLAGVAGFKIAHGFLGLFGVSAALIPASFCGWGLAMAFGLVGLPQSRRIIGFFTLILVLSGLAHVHLGSQGSSFGFGGSFGRWFGGGLQAYLSSFGATILLLGAGFVSATLSGNISLRRTRSLIVYSSVRLRKQIRAMIEARDILPQDPELLIKQALREEIKSSKSLGKRSGASAAGNANTSATSDKNSELGSGNETKSKSKKLVKIDLEKLNEEVSEEIANGDGEAVANGDRIDFYYNGRSHAKPTSGLFSRSAKAKDRVDEFRKMGEKLTNQLAQFKVDGKITKIVEGPVVTTFEFEPVPGTKVSKITSLSQDLARMLQATSLRILAPIPGKRVVGFEVPNAERRMIGFADLLEHRDLKSGKIELPIAMGVDAFGHTVIEDLAKMPHLLVAGSTGSGKSVFMNTLIGGLIARHSAKDLRFMMIDPKMVELAAYNALPHMATPVITDPSADAKQKLDALVIEMEDRFNKMRIVGARNIQGFNEVIKKSKRTDFPEFEDKWQTMPYIVLIIDELADMMMVLGKDAEIPITRLAQKARAAGIHLVIATQRPSAEVVTGLIKANFPTRVAFRVLSGLDSRTILDTGGAEGLIGQGDMLFLNAAGLRRMHGAYLSDKEVQSMVAATKK